MFNTSILSFGHCRVPGKERLEETIMKSVYELGEDEKRMRLIYYNSELVLDLFRRLDVNFEYRSFGVIPTGRERGGRIILKKIHENINIQTETELTDFIKDRDLFRVKLKKEGREILVESKYLVLATGGYGGSFKYNDNFRYKNQKVFDMVWKNRGKVINLNCIFVHPFGYCKGRKILIGSETKEGEFVDEKGKFIFDKETRNLIKNNDYHEIFDVLIKCEEDKIQSRGRIYFEESNRRLEIIPTVHYTAGGIKADEIGEVIGCKNLYAIGESRADGSKREGRFPWISFYFCDC